VIVLPLVLAGDRERRRLELLFGAVHSLKRALQHDVRGRLRAWRAGHQRTQRDPAGWLSELGLSREALERRAYRCLERSGWLLHHLTKAVAMHVADEVWATVDRHLFGDRDGRRSGMPQVTRCWDLGRIPGRARSHTSERKWETFRLFGTLRGHLAAHRHPDLPDEVATPAQAASLAPGTRVLAQPWRMRASGRPASWWDYQGPLVLVWNGGARSRAAELVLPVRLPQGSGRWPHLVHYLAEPERWHKVDLVRRRDASAVGGWAYEAHLMVLGPGYQSSETRARRQAAAALGRIGGVDGNVSRLAVVSVSASPEAGEATSTVVELSDGERARLARERQRDRARQRALDRSRRASNPPQYRMSERQRRRAERRAASGLGERQVTVRAGARESDASGRPGQPFRKDALSHGHRRLRVRHAEAAASLQKARVHSARRTAAAIVAAHGPRLTIEETDVRLWFRRWGRSCAAFTPGRLIRALQQECAASGGALLRVSTHRTALSQHCICGARVPKTLGQRTHACPECGLRGDRDLVSASLAAFATLERPGDPSSARVDYEHARRALGAPDQRLQAAVAESTALRPLVGAAAACRERASARRHAGHCVVPTPVGSIALPLGSHGRNPDPRSSVPLGLEDRTRTEGLLRLRPCE
jgi:transposase